MKFCEKCNIATENEICPKCNKKTRQIENTDMCFFGEYDAIKSDMFIGALEREKIKHVVMPVYLLAHNAKYCLPDRKQIFLKYGDFEKAEEIYKTMFGADK